MPNIAALAGIPSLPETGPTAIGELPLAALAEVTTVTSGHAGLPDLPGSSGQLTNLLPWSLLVGRSDNSCGVYMGEGFSPVPQKLADRICRREYVEMAEMLLEFGQCHPRRRVKGRSLALAGPSKSRTSIHLDMSHMRLRSTRNRMWDMSRFVMKSLLSLHSDKMLFFGTYKLLVTHLSRDSSCYSGVYERRIRF